MPPIRTFAAAAWLALAAAASAPAIAGDTPPPPPQPPPAGDLLRREIAVAEKAVDTTHDYLERNILARVVWFDEFFGSVKAEDTRRTEYLPRWQNALRWEEGGGMNYRTSARLNLRLPGISHRLHLTITGENEPEPAAGLPEDPGNPGFDRTLPNTRLVNTELRYDVVRRPGVDLFLGAGVRVTIPPETFVRSRLQYARRLGAASLARIAETVFWKDPIGAGETTELTLERALRPKTLLRWGGSGTVAQRSRGLEWGSELSLLQELSPRSAVALAGGVFGNTRPAVVGTYKLYSRYRRNAFRKWLFFELEPEVAWPRGPAGGYESAFAVTFRVDVVFEGKAPAETGRDEGPVVSPPASR